MLADPLTRALEHTKDGTPTDEDAAILAAEVERLRAALDEERALNDEADYLTKAIQSALCMLVEGPDAIGGFEARQQAIKILSDALQGGPDAR